MDSSVSLPTAAAAAPPFSFDRLRRPAEAVLIPLAALLVAMAVFGAFVAVLGKDPVEVYALIYKGAFSSAFAWQNTLQRAAPLLLTAL